MKTLQNFLTEALSDKQMQEWIDDAIIYLNTHNILTEREYERAIAWMEKNQMIDPGIHHKIEDALNEYGTREHSSLGNNWWKDYISIEEILIRMEPHDN